MDDLPRGIKNKNPGNVRLSGIIWQGSTVGSDPDFIAFTEMKYGIRCAAKIFLNYSLLDGLSSIAQFIERWAPSNSAGSSDDNPTTAYIDFVAANCGCVPNNSYNLQDAGHLSKLLDAVFRFENGGQYIDPSDLAVGVALALPEVPTA